MVFRIEVLIRCAVAYLVLPPLIFLAGWVRVEVALPCIVLSVISFVLFMRQAPCADGDVSLPGHGLDGREVRLSAGTLVFLVAALLREELDKMWKWHVYFAMKPVDAVFYSSFARRGANRDE